MVSTITPIPRSPEEVAEHVARKMNCIRDSLFSKEEYLADPSILNRVLWEPVGTGHQLVIKPHRTATPSPNAADSDDPTTETPISSSSEDDTTSPESTDAPLPNTTDAPLPGTTNAPLSDTGATTESSETPSIPAILSVVVQLIPGASWLHPDAKWTKDNRYKSHFQDAKLLCTGGVPKHPTLAPDFDTSIDNLNTIMSQLGDSRNVRNTIITSQPGSAQVKIRHCLFTPYDDPETAEPREIEMTEEWPTSNPDAAEALAKLVATHSVNPLPAYDQNGVLLEPHLYTRRLDGATVIIRFNLSHHLIRGKDGQQSSDTFSARIVQIRIIRPPSAALPVTPRKKKLLPTDDYFGSFTPTKRPRYDDDDDKGNGRPSKMRVIG